LSAQIAGRGGISAWGRGAEAEGAPPYWPWRRTLVNLAAQVDYDRVLQESGASAGDLVLIAPELRSFGPEEQASQETVGSERRFQLFQSVGNLIKTAAAGRGLLIILEDLHGADQPTLLLLMHLIRWVADAQILLLATFRPPEPDSNLHRLMPDLIRERAVARLDLGGLTPDQTRDFFSTMSDLKLTEPAVQEIHELTGGNPFFLAELEMRMSEWAERSGGSPSVPTQQDVSDLLQDRLKRLSQPALDMLKAASVTGQYFSVPVVANMTKASKAKCLRCREEAREAGLITIAPPEEEHRFAHALIRDAVESSLEATELSELHRAAALAIEEVHRDNLESHLADLARHWRAAEAGTGRLGTAVDWAERAAREANRRLAFEEAIRLYKLALDVGGTNIGRERLCDLLLALADSQYRASELDACGKTCVLAADIARSLGRLDLLARAALVMEGIGEAGWNLTVRGLCEEVLSQIGDDQVAAKARLLAQAANSSLYLGDIDRGQRESFQALELAEASLDPHALVSALRARQMACTTPEGVEERLQLADRMLEAGQTLGDPETQMWSHLWKLDAEFECGRFIAAGLELERLTWSVDQLGQPLARWHLLLRKAALAQARGDFRESLRICEQASSAVRAADNPAALEMQLGLECVIRHHIGYPAPVNSMPDWESLPWAVAQVIIRLGRAITYLDSGNSAVASLVYRSLGHPSGWELPPQVRIPALGVAAVVASGLGIRDHARPLYDLLLPDRMRHCVISSGVCFYLGTAELHLGRLAALMGDPNLAISHLSHAVDQSHNIGAQGYEVESLCLLAGSLFERSRPGDAAQAREILRDLPHKARSLGMSPFVEEAEALARKLSRQTTVGVSPSLSPREEQVAALVARGMTNREIAAELVLSERTAQNHVQHILDKLGFSARSQIAAWAARRGFDNPDTH